MKGPPTGALIDLSTTADYVAYLDGDRVHGSLGWVSLTHGWLERLVRVGTEVHRRRLRGRVELLRVSTNEVLR
jgi:hypothetical protein